MVVGCIRQYSFKSRRYYYPQITPIKLKDYHKVKNIIGVNLRNLRMEKYGIIDPRCRDATGSKSRFVRAPMCREDPMI
jgi:hypothetical protein